MAAEYVCRAPGCNVAVNGKVGTGAYCPDHRTRGARAIAATNGRTGLVAGLEACKALAKKADRLEARAKEMRRRADRAAVDAGDARDRFAEALNALRAGDEVVAD